jgi:hypothetical protein
MVNNPRVAGLYGSHHVLLSYAGMVAVKPFKHYVHQLMVDGLVY